MATIFDFNKRIQAVEIKPIIALCVEQSQYEILSFNRGQLYMGYGSNDNPLSPKYRSEGYAEFKQSQNPKPGLGTPDLFLSGAFYNSLQLDVNKSQMTFTVSSKDEKAPKLERKYGEKIYGLDSENKGYFSQEILRPKIIDKLRTAIGV